MGNHIRKAITSALILPVVLLLALLFSGLAKGTIIIYLILSAILIYLICKPFIIKSKINKAKYLIINENYNLVIDGITFEKNQTDGKGISARTYYVKNIDNTNATIYLNTYK